MVSSLVRFVGGIPNYTIFPIQIYGLLRAHVVQKPPTIQKVQVMPKEYGIEGVTQKLLINPNTKWMKKRKKL